MHLLLEHGADVSVRDRDSETVLYRAASLGLTQETNLLLDKGAPIEDRQNGMTALMVASNNRRAETTRSLLERGADLNSVLPATGYDPLCPAATGNRRCDSTQYQLMWTIKSLVDNGADLNGNKQKVPPLSLALLENLDLQFATVEALLDAGADVEKADAVSHTPLETWLSKSGWCDTSVLDLLLREGANLNKVNKDRRSPLFQACAAAGEHSVEQRVSVIQKLIEYKADINQPDENGDTPAMVICMNSTLTGWQKKSMLQLLLENGADAGLENRHKETLLIKAMRQFDLGTREWREVLILILEYI